MSRFKGKTHFAIFKEDETPWTQEEYDIVTTAFENPVPYYIGTDEATLKYIYYDSTANGEKYHFWFEQETTAFTLTDFTILGYNDFLKQLNPPIQRRKPL